MYPARGGEKDRDLANIRPVPRRTGVYPYRAQEMEECVVRPLMVRYHYAGVAVISPTDAESWRLWHHSCYGHA
jgi:hypothetical protein